MLWPAVPAGVAAAGALAEAAVDELVAAVAGRGRRSAAGGPRPFPGAAFSRRTAVSRLAARNWRTAFDRHRQSAQCRHRQSPGSRQHRHGSSQHRRGRTTVGRRLE